VTEIIST